MQSEKNFIAVFSFNTVTFSQAKDLIYIKTENSFLLVTKQSEDRV